MFSLADAYERFMGRWSRLLAPSFVRFAGVRGGEAILDVGSGTGALTAAIAAANPSGQIVGVDRSDAYVAFAQAHRPAGHVSFEVGDATRLPFDGDRFDRTMSLLILNFVPDPGSALAEMIRVTRPGGTIAAAVWDYGAGMGMLRTFWDVVVELDSNAERKDEGHMPLSREGELAALWSAHRLESVSSTALTVETRFSSFDDYWTPFLEGQGPAGAYAAALPEDRRDRLRLGLRHRLLGDDADRAIPLEARAWAVRGTLPPQR